MPERVLVVEDDPARLAWFHAWHPTMDAVDAPARAIALLQLGGYDRLYLDQDLGRGDAVGRDVSTWLAAHPEIAPALRIIVHSMNEGSAQKIERELRAAGRPVERIPFQWLVHDSRS